MRRRTFLFGTAGAVLASSRQSWAAPGPLGTIAFTQRDGLWIRDLPDGTAHKLVNGKKVVSPRFSPSGQWITYFHEDAVRVVSVDGSRTGAVGEVDRGNVQPGCQWWTGRDALLVSGEAGIKVFTAAGGWSQPSREIKGARLPVLFSPDGNELVYGDELEVGRGPGGEPMRTGRLSRLSLETPDSEPKVFVSNYLSGQILCAWSRHGEYILFWDDPDFSASAVSDGLELFRVSAASGPPVSLGVHTPVFGDMVSLSPARDQLALVAGEGRNQWEEKRLAIIDLRTAAISYLTDEYTAVASPSWSPSGQWIAFSAAPAPGTDEAHIGGGEPARRFLARRRIWIGDATGMTAPRPLTSDARYRDEAPMWSADGKQILFCRIDRRNHQTLWLTGADGASPVQVAELYTDPGLLGADGTWFGYYGYIDWRNMVDWFRGGMGER
jgi:dipeptidyl aminopeptidase/acylaminoacyl peptidase